MSKSRTQTLSHSYTSGGTSGLKIWPGVHDEENDGALAFVQRHPLGVKPSGNAMTANESLRDNMGFFSRLPDETILVFLEWLDSTSLCLLGMSCRGLFAYTSADHLWRDLFIMYGMLFLCTSVIPCGAMILPSVPFRFELRKGPYL